MWPFTPSVSYKSLKDISGREFDYIIVGGVRHGGCVLASRLSEDPSTSVLLLERGPALTGWLDRVPFLTQDLRLPGAPVYRWMAEPLTAAVGSSRILNNMTTGKQLGGTSRVNASVYDRCYPADYNKWEAMGRKGWGWASVEAFFKKSETSLSEPDAPHRGHTGPWKTRAPEKWHFAYPKKLIAASAALGFPYVANDNDPAATTVATSRFEVSLDRDGLRQSSFDAFLPLKVIRDREDNLCICPNVVVTSIKIQDVNGHLQAVGVRVEHEHEDGTHGTPLHIARARKEVVLCAGAIGTPQILMLSGVGPAKHLRSLGIPVMRDMPGVGSYLQDHTAVSLEWKVPKSETLLSVQQPLTLLRELVKYILTGDGLFRAPYPQLNICAISSLLDEQSHHIATSDLDGHNPDNLPDIEIMPSPISSRHPMDVPGFAFLCVTLRPLSTGSVRLGSLDPRARPVCDLGTFERTEDLVVMRKAVRLGLALGREMRRLGYPIEGELNVPKSENDADLDRFILWDTQTTFHYSSTCRMAPEHEHGVVDDELRVHGIQGLRIADASVFPTIPAGHLQAPAVMLGERCATFMTGR